MLYEITPPTLVLSTRYHKKLGVIENVDVSSITSRFTMSSHQEISFSVYKEADGVRCSLWDDIVDFKYVYVPEHDEYYEIQVDIEETNSTVKRVTGVSAGECELSQRYLRDFHCNDETDILMDDYVVTVLYNPDNPKGSLLNRILHDKCPDWSIGHVDSTIANIQRTFTISNSTVYDALVKTVAEEIECLFLFDSVNRQISAYDLQNKCNDCGFRGDFTEKCPKCGSRDFIKGYGKYTSIYISPRNFATQITVNGNADAVKNYYKIEGGDDLITATVANLNPNGTNYIYRFSNDMMKDMPTELVDKLMEYESLYKQYEETYQDWVQKYYDAIDQELYYQTSMMPQTPIPQDTTAEEQLNILLSTDFTVAVQNIQSTSLSTANLSVEGYAKAIVDPRYTVSVKGQNLTDLVNDTRTWSGTLTVKSLGGVNEKGEEDTATSTDVKYVTVNGDYEQFLKQKVDKVLDRGDAAFMSIYKIEDDDEFKEALKLYALDSLTSFSKTYEAVLEVLIRQGVPDSNSEFYGVELYNEIYVPYYNRKSYIEDEIIIREAEVNAEKEKVEEASNNMKAIQYELNLYNFLGEDLYKIFILYMREETYSNSNYISDGLENPEVIDKAKELLEVAEEEVRKSCELQYTLSGSLTNFMNTEEFADFKDEFEIGDWIVCDADERLYRLRLTDVEYSYATHSDISVTFSNAKTVDNLVDDVADILSKASSMATSYGYVAHQASQGDEANDFVEETKESGIDSGNINITAGTNQDIVIDKKGLTARNYDDTTGSFSPEQLKITNNIITFTSDNWATTEAALGKHTYTRYDPVTDAYVNGVGYGLSAKFVTAGYINGSQIVSGDIYSTNYSDLNKTGTHLDLDKGYFSFAGGDIIYDDQHGLQFHGEVITRNFSLDGLADLYIDHNLMDDFTYTITPSGADVNISQYSAYQVTINNGYGIYVPYNSRISGTLEAQKIMSNGAIFARGDVITYGTLSVGGFITAPWGNLYLGNDVAPTTGGYGSEYLVNVKSDAGSITMFSGNVDNNYIKGFRVENIDDEETDIITIDQENNVTINGVVFDVDGGIFLPGSITIENIETESITTGSISTDSITVGDTLEVENTIDAGSINVSGGFPTVSFGNVIQFVNNTDDYVTLTSGDHYLNLQANAYTTFASRSIEDNIVTMTDAEAKKLLQLRPVTFDYEYWEQDGQFGLIGEEVESVLPGLVNIPEDYDESEFVFVEGEIPIVPNIDYAKFVPHLIKLAQVQDAEISAIPIVGANPSGTATATLSTLEIDNTIYEITGGSNVVPNPSGTPTGTLNTIGIDSLVYDIAGGTNVVPNPTGAATEDLMKLQIGSDIYAITSGSSTSTALVPIMTSATTPSGTVTVSTQYNGNFAGYMAFDGNQCNISTMQGGWLCNQYDTTPTIQYAWANDETRVCSEIFIETANNGTTATKTVTIQGQLSDGTWENCLATGLDVELTFERGEYTEHKIKLNGHSYKAIKITGSGTWFIVSGTACTISRMQVYEINAYVEGNPTGTATEDLSSIRIGNTIYDIPSGGGSSYNYSTTEHEIGTWIDGSPIYERTFYMGGSCEVPSSGWGNTGITYNDYFGIIVNAEAVCQDNTAYYYITCSATRASGTGKLLVAGVTASQGRSIQYLTVRYTKPLIELIPTMTSATTPSGTVSASSYAGTNFEPYRAFDGANGTLQTLTYNWLPQSGEATSWIMYEFASENKFKKLKVRCMGSAQTRTVNFTVEGRKNGTFENCLATGSIVACSFPNGSYTDYIFDLNNEQYDAIRLTSDSQMFASGSYACGFDVIQVLSLME